MKEFRTAAEKRTETPAWIPFRVVGTRFQRDDEDKIVVDQYGNTVEVEVPEKTKVCHAMGEPDEGAVAVLMASGGKHVKTQDQLAAYLNFFDSVLSDESYQHIFERLMDPRDPFGLSDVNDIISFLMEEWSERPTRQSSGSIESRATTGPTSQPTTPQSTYSDSPYMPSST